MTEIATEFAGVPIHFENGRPDRRRGKSVPQKSISELAPLIENVLFFGVEIRWRQYTPYFNDGDPCEFSTSEVRFRLNSELDTGGDYEDGFFYHNDPQLAGGIETETRYVEYKTPDSYGRRGGWETVTTGVVYERHPAADAVDVFSTAFHSGAFENALYDLFGDHVEVTVTPTGIVASEYDHD